MERRNQSVVTEFILLGLTNSHENEIILFGVFSIIYLSTLLGNMLIIVTVSLFSYFNTPMYFFLRSLSLLDICFTSTIVPKMLVNFLVQVKTISFFGCVAQLYCFIALGGVECLLLAVMAYDRYVAICKPLHYTAIMSRRVCVLLTAAVWALACLNSLAHTVFTFRLPFCRSNQINHFFCDIPPMLELACADTHINEIVVYSSGGSVIIGSFLFTLLSYFYIISAIIKIRSSDGRLKAFSTCASHLTVVSMFNGTIIFTYIRPTSTYSLDQDRVIPVFYGIVTPLLNPIIYSLRNKEIHRALRRMIGKEKVTQQGP
ncbi:olfactory receptor 5V1-like [Microcaecilia unicolor]|uniref:Olfactory receptor n=1 Tax=Microcaecilia unicolor TaxID=1415580 RepID=A0A6P7WGP8_9AMPH|nr:olfactory receptor 5V1-like [Microcaecilia unicolor]